MFICFGKSKPSLVAKGTGNLRVVVAAGCKYLFSICSPPVHIRVATNTLGRFDAPALFGGACASRCCESSSLEWMRGPKVIISDGDQNSSATLTNFGNRRFRLDVQIPMEPINTQLLSDRLFIFCLDNTQELSGRSVFSWVLDRRGWSPGSRL